MKCWIGISLYCLWALVAAGQEPTKRLGDGNDGNRSTPVHWIELKDENGRPIRANDLNPAPFSPRQTCGECHDYDKISGGWHFSGHRDDIPAGRRGQPWVLVDAKTRTQIPISGRPWRGAYKPEQLGITPWEWLTRFASHYPGGSYGQMDADEPEIAIRQNISGKYEINCLICHHADPRQDASLAALHAARQNYRWVAVAASGKAIVNGVASELSSFFDPEFDEGLKTTYHIGTFDKDNKVFFDIVRKPPDDRCYFCHSRQDMRVPEEREWTRDEDVHTAAGLKCADCHRNGLDHQIERGMEGDASQPNSLSCRGCHLPGGGKAIPPQAGRLAAPKPAHWGIPTIHFEKLTCTACHSATWPQDSAGRWRTARIHKLGLHGKHKQDIHRPYVYAPVLMKGEDGKIGVYAMFWPSFWAYLKVDGGVDPIPPREVAKAAESILTAPSAAPTIDGWQELTNQQIEQTLDRLQAARPDRVAAYIAGGKLYQLQDNHLIASTHPAAAAYSWPMAHDVRPAQQALGVRQCADCHSNRSPFFAGVVPVDTPLPEDITTIAMIDLQGVDKLYMILFNFSFVFRPFLKMVIFTAGGLVVLVLLAFAMRVIYQITEKAQQECGDV